MLQRLFVPQMSSVQRALLFNNGRITEQEMSPVLALSRRRSMYANNPRRVFICIANLDI